MAFFANSNSLGRVFCYSNNREIPSTGDILDAVGPAPLAKLQTDLMNRKSSVDIRVLGNLLLLHQPFIIIHHHLTSVMPYCSCRVILYFKSSFASSDLLQCRRWVLSHLMPEIVVISQSVGLPKLQTTFLANIMNHLIQSSTQIVPYFYH